MPEVKHKRWLKIFIAIAVLIIAQLVWWATLFLRDTDTISRLKKQVVTQESALSNSSLSEQIQSEAFHRRWMFLSEALFFGVMTSVGLYLLYRALKVEERSREIQRNFVEIVTHESKTPLTALKLRLESVLERKTADSELTKDVELLLEEVRRLSSIVEKALNLNRLEREALTLEPLSLSEVVKQVLRRLDSLLRAKQVSVDLKLEENCVVLGDPFGLQNSVQSLIENAILYNDKDEKRVAIWIHRKGAKASLRIEDNGPGIRAADRERVFERFYRGKNTRRVPGTGLGLYLARTLIEAHQGTLRLLETSSPGTHFEIELPLAEEST